MLKRKTEEQLADTPKKQCLQRLPLEQTFTGIYEIPMTEKEENQFYDTGGDLTPTAGRLLGLFMMSNCDCCLFLDNLEKYVDISPGTMREMLQTLSSMHEEFRMLEKLHTLIPKLLSSRGNGDSFEKTLDQVEKVWNTPPNLKLEICNDCKCRVKFCENCCEKEE